MVFQGDMKRVKCLETVQNWKFRGYCLCKLFLLFGIARPH